MKSTTLYSRWAFALATGAGLIAARPPVASADSPADEFRESIRPILEANCFDCHAHGMQEGEMAFDAAASDQELLADREFWWAVLRNLRAGIMPPSYMEPPPEEDKEKVLTWIKTDVFGVDPEHPDPGESTLRRLNRVEYGATVRDLMGVDFNAEILFPPDDAGGGFDNVAGALSVSPLLLEKYLQAARTIVAEAAPTRTWVIPTQEFSGNDFRSEDDSSGGDYMEFTDPATVTRQYKIEHDGRYTIRVHARLDGTFFYTPARCEVAMLADGEELSREAHGWQERKDLRYEFERRLPAGEHELTFRLKPLPDSDKKADEDDSDEERRCHYRILKVEVVGPDDRDAWKHPKNYGRFYPREAPPEDPDERREYAREVLGSFAKKAFRRPADEELVTRLVGLAEQTYSRSSKTFEEGIADAMVATLASPRFLFRIEAPAPGSSDERFPRIDEYALASRLSYLLWSTMPDDELFALAEKGELRANLKSQVERMLDDRRSQAFLRNFVGQWLRTRDVEHVSIDALAAMGLREEWEELRSSFFRRRRGDRDGNDEEAQRVRERFRELRELRETFDGDLRRSMRREVEMLFGHIVEEDRSLLELIDSDYAFLNEELAEHYGVPGVEGRRMQRVPLPEESPRGGVLTAGAMLSVTSNPTRTSPVKRGLFVLENLLGTPPPPPPPDVPELEDAADKFGDREPTLRELLAAHRESALCSSCHNRMDPLGLALENFNAIGMWRDEAEGQPVDAAGELITGEPFEDVRELKRVLRDQRRADFYRCVTQKLLTYAVGRELEYYDELTVDRIVDRLEENEGRFSALLTGVLESAPFQRQRRPVDDTHASLSGGQE